MGGRGRKLGRGLVGWNWPVMGKMTQSVAALIPALLTDLIHQGYEETFGWLARLDC